MLVERFRFQAGISTIELLVAMSVLATAAIGVFGILSNTETQLLSSRSDLNAQQSEEALGAYLYEEFITFEEGDLTTGLTDSKEEQDYFRGDFRNIELRYRSLMGYQKRYEDEAVTAKCRLTAATSELVGTVSFAADCVTVPEGAADNLTIAQVMNELLHDDIPISFGLAEVGALCSVSTPMDNATTGDGQIAVMTVDDPGCLNSLTADLPMVDAEVILPRFVVYSSEDTNRYNTSLIDRPSGKTVGIELEGPESISAGSGVARAETGYLLSSLSDDETGVVTFTSPLAGARIFFSDDAGVTIIDNNTNSVTLSGTFGLLKEALGNFYYQSPDGYFGSDSIRAVARSGQLRSVVSTDVTISPNCGNQLLGTATRLDLGVMDNTSGVPFFDETSATFITTVSVYDNSSPTHYYGYCRPNSHRYDYVTQSYENSGNMCNPTSTHNGIEYQRYSSRKMEDNGTVWNQTGAINVFLYEESDSTTEDRYALFFVLDGYPGICASGTAPTTLEGSRSSGNAMTNADFKDLNLPDDIWPNSDIPDNSDRRCRLAFRLSNIEPGRDLDDLSDLHTFTDDPDEYTGVIGTDGRLSAQASWQVPIDGVVVPLRVNDTSTSPVELENYTFGNPIFELIFWDTLQKWNIRALNTTTNEVEFTEFNFTDVSDGQTQAIRMNINQSRRCGT